MIRPYKGRAIKPGRKVFAYRNLHESVWSIQQGGLVVAHAEAAVISGAKFTVGEKGRQKVIATGQKNVHAGVRGYLRDQLAYMKKPVDRVSYSPFKAGHFYRVESGEPIHEAEQVFLDPHGKAWAQ